MAPPVSRAPVMQDFLAQGIIHHHRAVKVLIGEHDRVVDVPVLHMRKVANAVVKSAFQSSEILLVSAHRTTLGIGRSKKYVLLVSAPIRATT
ncbi:hypothetical protein SNOG_05703 [Parastagonospora nodorum SN15]|uniref:Uncharacterized protein n=1 Tax=Phaeosphaeria nodorum (strain SN15 / ATCC MYA-4574 / FGSC 10173) TaxID=321614 RepID=Q0URB1_PHANO|nr:hypothetical protein SNOG_05703 [Parastagonospora nodorum SN15]EAT86767.1 hypothetical protein SNOG_05703 [Parastagonospora nodorum SN15]